MQVTFLALRVSLNGNFASFETFEPGDASLRFVSQDTSTPVTTQFIVSVVEVRLDGLDDLAQTRLVIRVHISQGQR